MKRVVVAALVAAGVGLVAFNAPAQGSTGHAGTMRGNAPGAYRFAKGSCETTSAENGVFNVEVGDSVQWANCSNTSHTVTGSAFGSTDPIGPGDSSPIYTFNSPGTFAYHCEIHATMTGTVNVTGPASTTPATTATTTPPTTAAVTTTSSTTPKSTTTTKDDLDGVFGNEPTTSTTPTTVDPTVTTRALGEGGEDSTSAGTAGLLVLGLGAVGTAGALIIRRMRGGTPPS